MPNLPHLDLVEEIQYYIFILRLGRRNAVLQITIDMDA